MGSFGEEPEAAVFVDREDFCEPGVFDDRELDDDDADDAISFGGLMERTREATWA